MAITPNDVKITPAEITLLQGDEPVPYRLTTREEIAEFCNAYAKAREWTRQDSISPRDVLRCFRVPGVDLSADGCTYSWPRL